MPDGRATQSKQSLSYSVILNDSNGFPSLRDQNAKVQETVRRRLAVIFNVQLSGLGALLVFIYYSGVCWSKSNKSIGIHGFAYGVVSSNSKCHFIAMSIAFMGFP